MSGRSVGALPSPAAIERVNLADWIVRAAHISGQIVAQFEKSGVARVRRREDRQAA